MRIDVSCMDSERSFLRLWFQAELEGAVWGTKTEASEKVDRTSEKVGGQSAEKSAQDFCCIVYQRVT